MCVSSSVCRRGPSLRVEVRHGDGPRVGKPGMKNRVKWRWSLDSQRRVDRRLGSLRRWRCAHNKDAHLEDVRSVGPVLARLSLPALAVGQEDATERQHGLKVDVAAGDPASDAGVRHVLIVRTAGVNATGPQGQGEVRNHARVAALGTAVRDCGRPERPEEIEERDC